MRPNHSQSNTSNSVRGLETGSASSHGSDSFKRDQPTNVDALEYQAAQSEVEMLKAEFAGDPVAAAEVRVRAARDRLALISKMVEAGRSGLPEKAKAEAELAIAEAMLQEAKARAATKP